jgi:hypothetical protein
MTNSFNNFNSLFGGAALSDRSKFPFTGTATYDGQLVATIPAFTATDPDDDQFAANLLLTVDFSRGTNPVSGTLSNFVSEGKEELQGSVTLANSQIDRTAAGVIVPFTGAVFDMSTTLNGTLTDASLATVGIDGAMGVDFKGTTRQGIIGQAAGNIRFPGIASAEWEGNIAGKAR